MQSLKQKVIAQIKEQGVIAIIRGVSVDSYAQLLRALNNGGLKVAEVTFGAQSDEQTCSLLKVALNNACEGQLIGAGTVTNLTRAKMAVENGAQFIVSPNVNQDVIKFCNDKGVCVVSGAFTPTEILTANQFGADFVKVFPANVLGAQYFKALKSPLGNISLLAFAGINVDNVGEYIKAGAIGVGVGSELINLKAINSGNFAYVENYAKQLLDEVKNARK